MTKRPFRSYPHAILLFCLTMLLIPSVFAQRRVNSSSAAPSTTLARDVKIRTRVTANGQSFESTSMIKGARKRDEQALDPNRATIMQCDLKRFLTLDNGAKTYTVERFGSGANDAGTATSNTNNSGTTTTATAATVNTPRRGGVITYTTTYVDTGERKQFFGYTARHIKSTMAIESSPEACTQTKMRSETDGWYIDFKRDFNCEMDYGKHVMARMPQQRACTDEVRYKTVGKMNEGFPVLETITMYVDGGRSFTTTNEVIELSTQPLEAALFDVPAGYREVKNELGANSGAAQANDEASSSAAITTPSQTSSEASAVKSAAVAAATLGPKKAGTIRIGVVLPKMQMAREGAVDTGALGEGFRRTLIGYLTGADIEPVPLAARLPQEAIAEAKQKECDFIFYSTLTQKKGGGGFGGFGSLASAASSAIPYGSTAGAVAATTAVIAISNAETIAKMTKAKDEMRLDYNLVNTGDNTPRLTDTVKAKAKSDGEDVVSTLLQQAAPAVLTSARKKQ